MLTKKGHTTRSLLNVTVHEGTITIELPVPRSICKGDMLDGYLSDMADHINDRISTEKKPAATYEKLLGSIDTQREQLADFYTRLFECYQRAIDDTPKVRRSAKDIAMVEMLAAMPDKMLREFCKITLGDNVDEYILPDDREALYDAYIAVTKKE